MTEASAPLRVLRDARGVARLQLDRPDKHNAFDEALIAALHEAVRSCGADPAVRVLLLEGRGASFCAGADIAWMRRAAAASQADNLLDAQRFAALLHTIASCPKPVLARVQGLALGGGAGLVAACDMAIAADDAQFAISEVRFGILPAVIGPYLIRAVGQRQAQALALTAERMAATEALRIGLLHRVVPLAELDAAVDACTALLLAAAPQAQGEVKQLFARLSPGDLGEATRELTAQTIARVRAGAEAREGFAAFTEKRSPAWTR